MASVPAFFVPNVAAEDQEEYYRELGRRCGRAVSAPEERVYSIVYIHDGTEWTATVGKQLRGETRRVVRSRGGKTERTTPTWDGATVLAIYPGDPFFVWTNLGIAANVRSQWVNPFMAGRPQFITLFPWRPQP